MASSAATSAQTYAGNASTSEQNCATYASNARASAEEAQEYVESLDNWTTIEFNLDDFIYSENSGVTYLPIEAPSGYRFEEIRGYIVSNKIEVDSSNTFMSMEATISIYDDTIDNNRACNIITVGPSQIGLINRVIIDYNNDLKYLTCTGFYGVSSDIRTEQSTSAYIAARSKSLLSSSASSSRIVLKTNTPHSNISELYGKLQYRLKSTT